jgi:hypothetical protein
MPELKAHQKGCCGQGVNFPGCISKKGRRGVPFYMGQQVQRRAFAPGRPKQTRHAAPAASNSSAKQAGPKYASKASR